MIVGVFSACPLVFQFHRVNPTAIAIARHPEILHHQQTVFIAGIEKLRPLNEGPAPYANEVQVHVAMIADLCIIALITETEHGITDDPVTAFDEYFLSVHRNLFAAGSSIPGGLN